MKEFPFNNKPDVVLWIRAKLNCSLLDANDIFNFISKLTKLDHFAGLAMQAMISRGAAGPETVAVHSIKYAKELIKKLEAEK